MHIPIPHYCTAGAQALGFQPPNTLSLKERDIQTGSVRCKHIILNVFICKRIVKALSCWSAKEIGRHNRSTLVIPGRIDGVPVSIRKEDIIPSVWAFLFRVTADLGTVQRFSCLYSCWLAAIFDAAGLQIRLEGKTFNSKLWTLNYLSYLCTR